MVGVNQPRTEIIALDILRDCNVIWKAPKNSDGTISVCIKDKKLHVTFNVYPEYDNPENFQTINGVRVALNPKEHS